MRNVRGIVSWIAVVAAIAIGAAAVTNTLTDLGQRMAPIFMEAVIVVLLALLVGRESHGDD